MATLCLVSHFLSSVMYSRPQRCQSLNDIYNKAKHLWQQRNYKEAYRVFCELGETHGYKPSTCAWYKIQCLVALGHWHQAITTSLEQTKKCSSDSWHLMASDIYMKRCDFTLAWEILNQAPSSTKVMHNKRLAYEGTQHSSCVRRTDILDKLPYDITIHVFSCLDLPSLVRCTRVSKRWRQCLVFSPQLWNELEFANRAEHLAISTVHVYLSRLGRTPLTKLVIRHQQADGDGILLALAQRQCHRLKTLSMVFVILHTYGFLPFSSTVITDMICTPALFFDALEYIGSTLCTFHWGGVSLRLNDLMNVLPTMCKNLKYLAIKDCFTSLNDAQLHNGATYRLDTFGDRFPLVFLEVIEKLSPLPYIETLELSGVHGLTASHLASILVRCPNLKKLVLNRCLVNIIPVLNILQTNCPKLQHLEYERNRYCQQFDLYQIEPVQGGEKRYEPYYKKPQYPWKQIKIHLTHMLTDSVISNVLNSSKSTLEALDLRGNTLISDQGLLSDTPMKSLKCLCLKECYGIGSKGLATLLAQSPLLENVDFSHLGTINDAVLQQLAKCQQLKTLDLSYAHLSVTDETFKYFVDQRLSTLEKLVLDYTVISKELLCYSMMKLRKGAI